MSKRGQSLHATTEDGHEQKGRIMTPEPTPIQQPYGETVSHDELLARLGETAKERETWMKRWDDWRAYIREGGGGSWPRDAFESLLDAVIEDSVDAAADIRDLSVKLKATESRLAERREHNDFAPHEKCTCNYCAALKQLEAERAALLTLAARIRREGMQGVANQIEEIVK